MELYTSRLYIKFKEEKDWKQFIDTVEFESYKDHEKHLLSEYKDYFPGSVETDFAEGIRISSDDLDCLMSSYYSENVMESLVYGYTELFDKMRVEAILLADSYNCTHSPGKCYEYYYLGGYIHEFYRGEDADEPANEHYKIDIADCRKWLGEERTDELTYREKELLDEIGGPRKKVISEEEKRVLKKIHRNDEIKTLKDIFPKINRERNNGLVIDNGICLEYEDLQDDYLGIETHMVEKVEDVDDAEWFIPGEVVEFDEHNDIFFHNIFQDINNVVLTTNLRRIQPEIFKCNGFKHLYFIDPETEEVLFHSEKFQPVDKKDRQSYDELCDDELWNEFCNSYNKWSAAALINPWFYDPEINSSYDSMDWAEYVDRLMNSQPTESSNNCQVSEEDEQQIKDGVTIEQSVSDEKVDEPTEEKMLSSSLKNDQVSGEKEMPLKQDDENELTELDYEDEEYYEDEEDDEDYEDDEDDEPSEYEKESVSISSYWISEEKKESVSKDQTDSSLKAEEQPAKKKSFWAFLTGGKKSSEDSTDHSLDGTYTIANFFVPGTTVSYTPAEMGAMNSKLSVNGNHLELDLYVNGENLIKGTGTFSLKKNDNMVFYINNKKIGTGSWYKSYGIIHIIIMLKKLPKYMIWFDRYHSR